MVLASVRDGFDSCCSRRVPWRPKQYRPWSDSPRPAASHSGQVCSSPKSPDAFLIGALRTLWQRPYRPASKAGVRRFKSVSVHRAGIPLPLLCYHAGLASRHHCSSVVMATTTGGPTRARICRHSRGRGISWRVPRSWATGKTRCCIGLLSRLRGVRFPGGPCAPSEGVVLGCGKPNPAPTGS